MYVRHVVPTYSSYPLTEIKTLVRRFCNPISLYFHLSVYLFIRNYSRVDFATQMSVQGRKAALATTQQNFSRCYCRSATRTIALPFLRYPHTHVIYCQCFTVGPISLCFLLSLPSSISANLFEAQIVSPISCLQYLPRTLSMSFHAPFNPHTSIH